MGFDREMANRSVHGLGRGVALRGTVWPGGPAEPFDGVVVVAGDGTVAALGPAGEVPLPEDLPMLGKSGCWVGPGVVDAHVHLAFGGLAEALPGGLVAVRDLGAPMADALAWRTGPDRSPPPGRPRVAVAGPVCTAPGGYPSRSWGANGFAAFAGTPQQAGELVRRLAAAGVDLIKVALEPGPGWPVPPLVVLRAVVEAAHQGGLAVTAHALSAAMVARALAAGVDELAHTPLERLTEPLVEQIAAAGIPVVSTLHTLCAGRSAGPVASNAADLHRAGVPLLYGTDLGNAGTRPGVDPRELDRLAAAGLGRLGALRAATEGSARAAGNTGRSGLIELAGPAALVLLDADPLVEPRAWRRPRAVVCDRLLLR